MHSGRERKTKPGKSKKDKPGLRQRKGQATDGHQDEGAADAMGWSSALDPELQHGGSYGASKHARKGRDRKQKKSGRNQADERTFEDVDLGADDAGSDGAFEPYFQPPEPWPSARPGAAFNMHKLSENLFVSWEELLGSREAMKRRVDTIAAVHGWEGASAQKSFLGGVEPSGLLQSIKAEIVALEPAADALETADLLLELQSIRAQLGAAGEERDRLAEDLHQSQEECFEARDLLAGQSTELETLRQEAVAVARLKAAEVGGDDSQVGSKAPTATEAAALADAGIGSSSDPLGAFKVTLSRGQTAEGRRIVHALERLKLPDESVMGPRELACWHENKKTIMNSLKTLSSQIYSATTRILYEIIQNADDCSFEDGNDVPEGTRGAVRELYLECSDDALVAFHNEKGFQPKDLYAMCQVGESSKAAGSGKIGRKGIGFKSVFQICDRPIVCSPPFQFCFDTVKHEVFGYIVPSWLDSPGEHVPARHREHLARIFPDGSVAPSATGTLLVCPMAPRVRGLDLMRDLSFDGLSLAFLKNLEKISFVSSVSRSSAREDDVALPAAGADATIPGIESSRRESIYRVEKVEQDVDGTSTQGVADTILKGISVVSHTLDQCTIIQRENTTETRRHYRLHSYQILKYKPGSTTGGAVVPGAGAGAAAAARPATTTISLAFPVDDTLAPMRSAEGELIFAYLPVTAAGFGFGINADFELVASRQDVSDSHSGNHVLLGRIPPLFVHSILTDPALGEDAFATYLPDVESIRKDRSGGGRKWHTLASALHRETGAWMMIPTEDAPERVKRKHVVLRPKHLSQALVPNSLLKEATRILDSGEQNFAHPNAVVAMALENCIAPCPVAVVLDCIRMVLNPVDEDLLLSVFDDGDPQKGMSKKKQKGKKQRGKKVNLWPGDVEGDFADYARRHNDGGDAPAARAPTITEDVLLDIWRYLAAECEICLKQGEAGKSSLRLIVDAIVGYSVKETAQLFRIFPVRGTSKLRLHSEYGVPLSTGLSPSLAAQGPSVLRLAERVVPRLDTDRLQGVEGLAEAMAFLRIGDATEIELEQQLKNCFRFGIATTADPQLWWDSFRYAVSRGFAHGLAGFMPGSAIALPLVDSRGGVVSSRDVQRLSVGLPCLLGLRRKPTTNIKYLLAIPPSASTWSARVHWELAIVQAFGVAYPKSDVERIPAGAFVTDLLYAVLEARESGKTRTLGALGELLTIYKSRLGSLLPLLRSAAQTSSRPEECLLEKRAEFQPFASSCSPKFVDEMLSFCNVALSDDSFHNIRDLLESSLGMLRLRLVGASKHEDEAAAVKAAAAGVQDIEVEENDSDGDSAFESAEEESSEGREASTTVTDGDDVDEDEDDGDDDGDEEACDEATWEVLERLLGFHHTFEPRDCPWVLYSALTPALLEKKDESAWDEPHVPKLNPIALAIRPFLATLGMGTIVGCDSDSVGCQMDVAADLWPLISTAGGMWLGGDFVSLERCVWKSERGEIWQALGECGCLAGRIVDIETTLVQCMDGMQEAPLGVHGDSRATFLASLGSCCTKGSAKRQGSTWAPGLTFPALPHPTDLEMMLNSTLPMLLDRERADESPEAGFDHQWSQPTLSCYNAVIGTLASSGFPRGQRWLVPVPSVRLCTCHLVVDRALNRSLARDAAALLVLPDTDNGTPMATDFALRHYGEHCLHPALVPLFTPVAERQSVGFESPRALIQRTFRRSLRLAAADATTPAAATPAAAAAAAAASRLEGSHDGLGQLWDLISEVYERPLAAEEVAGEDQGLIPSGLSDADNWELLMWAAITCAREWFLMQATSNPQHASRYQETLQRVRRLVPFVEASSSSESWCFLSERRQGTTDEDGVARGVLLLRTLFGFQLWGNLNSGLELLERAPAYTTDIPTSILFTCTGTSRLVDASTGGGASFPEDFDRPSLVLMWEWFLLEVAGAAPPAVLWSTVQEPIAAWARPRIRQAEAAIRAESPGGINLRLLECVHGHTQVGTLMDEMDAVDEARAAAAAREAEARRREREAIQARMRAEAEVLRQQREWERQEEEQRRLEEREERRARRAAQEAMDAAVRGAASQQPRSPPQPQHGRRSQPRDDNTSPESAPRRNRERAPAPEEATPAAAPASTREMRAQTVAQMRDMIRTQQEEIDRMRAQLQTTVRVPAAAMAAEAQGAQGRAGGGGGLGGMANTFARMFGGGGGGAAEDDAGGGGAARAPVRRHVDGQTMRESEVKGKLARFLAGMRAYERQQAMASAGTAHQQAQQPLPPVLSEFIAWAGDVLAGDQQPGGGGNQRRGGGGGASTSVEETARRYVAGGGSTSSGGGGAAADAAGGDTDDTDEEESCCICLENLRDAATYELLGEPLETACGHRFHAVCYAKTMESSQQDPWCPICRSDTFGTSARFI